MPYSEVAIGDVVCWTATYNQTAPKLNMTLFAIDLPQKPKSEYDWTGTVCHRVIWRNQTNFMTKGDANPVHDNIMLSFKGNYNYKVIEKEGKDG